MIWVCVKERLETGRAEETREVEQKQSCGQWWVTALKLAQEYKSSILNKWPSYLGELNP